jgi:two-component system LytT family response regulator
MLRAVIIDDEPNNIDNLRELLSTYCPEVIIVASAINSAEGKTVIHQHSPELVFLDIQMPGESGFDLLRSLSNSEFEIIFVTAFDQYGIQAVKFAAIDYLLKPVDPEELQKAVEKTMVKSQQKKQNVRLENLLQYLEHSQHKNEHRIALPGTKETRFAYTREIIRCESSNNYTSFYLTSGEKLIVSKPIYEYEELLEGYGFIRCHQSHLINKAHVKSWVREDGGYLLLDDKTQVPVSRQKKEMVRREIETLRKS